MKIAILQCDNVLEKFQPQFGNYPAMVQRMFEGVEPAPEFIVYNCREGQYPDDIGDYDCYITTGSKASVYDDEAWIKRLIEFIRELDTAQSKLIGICFGHQLIALARDGKVEKSTKGWGVGIASNEILSAPDWMEESPERLNILVSHQDQITQLPEGAQVLAGTKFCPYFLVQWDEHFLSVQGHPEWHNEYSRTLIDDRRAIIPADTVEAGLSSLDQAPDNDLFTRWIVCFVGKWRVKPDVTHS